MIGENQGRLEAIEHQLATTGEVLQRFADRFQSAMNQDLRRIAAIPGSRVATPTGGLTPRCLSSISLSPRILPSNNSFLDYVSAHYQEAHDFHKRTNEFPILYDPHPNHPINVMGKTKLREMAAMSGISLITQAEIADHNQQARAWKVLERQAQALRKSVDDLKARTTGYIVEKDRLLALDDLIALDEEAIQQLETDLPRIMDRR